MTEIDLSNQHSRSTTLSLALTVNFLSQALRVNKSLTTLDLSSNFISAEGATSLSRALIVNTCLTTLYLSHNSIRAEGDTPLSQALTVNTSPTTFEFVLQPHWSRDCCFPFPGPGSKHLPYNFEFIFQLHW